MTMATYAPDYWYAVVMNYGDTDWGTGSKYLDEALLMAKEMKAHGILVIEDGADPVAVDYIEIMEG